MAVRKGAGLEELVRAYFARQGFFVLRSTSLRFEDEEVTDIDVWAYGRQSPSIRTRTIIDVKDKRSPKTFERVLWAKGMQLALGCDRAIVATTDANPKVTKFANQQKVALLSKAFLERLEKRLDIGRRFTLEEFLENIYQYKDHKLDGDWIRTVSDAKSALISLQGYPAFNKAISAFKFFGSRAETRAQHRDQALRCAYLTASLACIALDSALERLVYEDNTARFRAISTGVTYGDAGDARIQNSVDTVLDVLANGMENGRVIARQARDALDGMFESVRADIIAEFFSREHNAAALFSVAKELEELAHAAVLVEAQELSRDAKSVLGVFADFARVKRGVLIGGRFTREPSTLNAEQNAPIEPLHESPAKESSPQDEKPLKLL